MTLKMSRMRSDIPRHRIPEIALSPCLGPKILKSPATSIDNKTINQLDGRHQQVGKCTIDK